MVHLAIGGSRDDKSAGLLQLLASYGADFEMQNSSRETPLLLAVIWKDVPLSTVKFLCDRDGIQKSLITRDMKNGSTPLGFAVIKGAKVLLIKSYPVFKIKF